jgi:hypothetical protein
VDKGAIDAAAFVSTGTFFLFFFFFFSFTLVNNLLINFASSRRHYLCCLLSAIDLSASFIFFPLSAVMNIGHYIGHRPILMSSWIFGAQKA